MAGKHEPPPQRRHPGAGRRRGRNRPRGRQVDPDALEQIRALLGDRPRRRDLLIEHLHLIQDRYRVLSAAHLAALADEMRLALAEVYEVATFYAHFDVARAEGELPADVTVRVCDGLVCEMMGARRLLEDLPGAVEDGVRVMPGPCMGGCDRAPVARVGQRLVVRATVDELAQAARSREVEAAVPEYRDYGQYAAGGGYGVLRACLDGGLSREDVVDKVSASGLQGLGGAGFPTGRKWQIVRGYPGPRLMAVNADEGEPGTFKDRYFMESDPHRFLEGVLVAAWAVEAEAAYIYLRDEYAEVREILSRELPRLREAGLDAHVELYLRRGAGAYICGEESAMIESIEGKRGLPRHRPPYVAETGLFGRPTLVQNVETLYWIRDIVERGPEWFTAQGRNGGAGLHAYSVSGRVARPGVKIAATGITVRELIDEHCGGMQQGHRFKGYLPGGASGGMLPASMADLPLKFGSLEEHGCFVGSHGVVVLSDQDDVKSVVRNLMRFFKHESCGQCTPCRVGTEKAVGLLQRPSWDEPLLEALGVAMTDASICGLGQAAPNSVRSAFRFFKEDLS
ncbi:MAG: NAD(P)H-dependent oxidoreductase subunit E [Deltaproteobacteria bacterium]|nr:NAD(P)H-dependent oxidoreductase subunit E [Deltaproteobacteria bacterium]